MEKRETGSIGGVYIRLENWEEGREGIIQKHSCHRCPLELDANEIAFHSSRKCSI